MFKPPVYSHSVILPCIRVIVSRCLGPVDDLTERPPHADHGGHPLIPKKEAVDAFEKVILSHHPLNPHTSKKSKGELYELGNQIITDLEGETNDWNMVWSTNTTGAIRLLFDHYYWGSGKKTGTRYRYQESYICGNPGETVCCKTSFIDMRSKHRWKGWYMVS